MEYGRYHADYLRCSGFHCHLLGYRYRWRLVLGFCFAHRYRQPAARCCYFSSDRFHLRGGKRCVDGFGRELLFLE